MAGATGLEPVIFPVTGEYVNQTTPRAHVPVTGIEPVPKPYESSALTPELHRQNLLRGAELHGCLEVMGLARYYFSTPRRYYIVLFNENQAKLKYL